ncbi:hypothetical protein H5410_016748 [Solanum commersonii]|uniref:Uncharacterized protein n=1 Tax=Solanum commersonii TaxID=4109 RepID=A0A9J5ZY99_SOLCO|nr:hypothetical protein H5410_016748 [Solanum commersonii]
MANTGRFCHSSLSGNFFYTMLSRSFLVHQIVLITRDFEEQMQPPFQPGEISEEELEQYDSKKMAIKGQIYHISQSRHHSTPQTYLYTLLCFFVLQGLTFYSSWSDTERQSATYQFGVRNSNILHGSRELIAFLVSTGV